MENFFLGIKRLSFRIHFLLIIVNFILYWVSVENSGVYIFGELDIFGLDPVESSTMLIIISGIIFNYVLGSFVFFKIKEDSNEVNKLNDIEKKIVELIIKLDQQNEQIKDIYLKTSEKNKSDEK